MSDEKPRAWAAFVLKSMAGTAVLLIVLLLLGLAAEGLLRLSYHFRSRRFIHPYLGETYKPNYRRLCRTPEGRPFEYRLNNYAFRGDDIPDTKPPGAIYVVTLGGSTTACNEYPEELTWPGVLQVQLRQLLGNEQIHVFNAGMAGATSYRSLLIFLNFLPRIQPDLVILYEGANDRDRERPTCARFFKDLGHGEEFLQRRSFLLTELAQRTQNPLLIALARGLERPAKKSADFAYHEDCYRKITYLARGYRIPLMFMTQPLWDEGTNREVNRSTLQLGKELDVPVFDLDAVMAKDAEMFLPDRVHYTISGNRFIGEHVARWVVQQGLLPPAKR